MCIYAKNNPAEFHPDPILNDRVLSFLKMVAPNNTKNKMNSDIR